MAAGIPTVSVGLPGTAPGIQDSIDLILAFGHASASILALGVPVLELSWARESGEAALRAVTPRRIDGFATLIIRRWTPDAGPVEIQRTNIAAHPFSDVCTEAYVAAKAPHLIERALRELYIPQRGGIGMEEMVAPRPLSRVSEEHQTRSLSRMIREELRRVQTYNQWCLAYSTGSVESGQRFGSDLCATYRALVPPPGRSWADPFPVVDDGTFLGFRDLPHSPRKGHISVMQRTNEGWTTPVPVLTREYHLSYPFVFRWNDDWYLMPETAHAMRLEVYRATCFPYSLGTYMPRSWTTSKSSTPPLSRSVITGGSSAR